MIVDLQPGRYETFIVMGDFKVAPNDAIMKNFFQIFGCENIVKNKTYFKSRINPTCSDLIITNRLKFFQESEVIGTGLSDVHKMSLTFMKVLENRNVFKIESIKVFPMKLSCVSLKLLHGNFSNFIWDFQKHC